MGLIAYAAGRLRGEGSAQLNLVRRLVVEFDGGPDRFQIRRKGGALGAAVDTRQNANAFPELTESTFAR